jgi:transposase
MIFVGLDLHKRYITACAVDSEGTIVASSRRLPADWPALAAWLAALPTPRTVVLESCLYCWWLERELRATGDAVLVVDPHQVKLIWQARTKTDPIDAHKLAELARANVLPALWVPDPTTRARRQALRTSSQPRTANRTPTHGGEFARPMDLSGAGRGRHLSAPWCVATTLLLQHRSLSTQIRA